MPGFCSLSSIGKQSSAWIHDHVKGRNSTAIAVKPRRSCQHGWAEMGIGTLRHGPACFQLGLSCPHLPPCLVMCASPCSSPAEVENGTIHVCFISQMYALTLHSQARLERERKLKEIAEAAQQNKIPPAVTAAETAAAADAADRKKRCCIAAPRPPARPSAAPYPLSWLGPSCGTDAHPAMPLAQGVSGV